MNKKQAERRWREIGRLKQAIRIEHGCAWEILKDTQDRKHRVYPRYSRAALDLLRPLNEEMEECLAVMHASRR